MPTPDAPYAHLAGRIETDRHVLPVRIYYEDTDAGGIVYHAGYLRFLERGRTDHLRLLGVDQSALASGPDGVLFAVRQMTIDFLKPAKLDDVVEIVTRPVEVAGARLVLDQAVTRGADQLVTARVTIAAVGSNGRPRRLPDVVRSAFASLHGGR